MFSSTFIWFTTTPSNKPSNTHDKYAGWILYIVEQGQTTESRQNIFLFGFYFDNRLTRLISVPIAQVELGSESAIIFLMNSVDPT